MTSPATGTTMDANKDRAKKIMSGMFGSANEDEEEKKKRENQPSPYQRLSKLISGKKG